MRIKDNQTDKTQSEFWQKICYHLKFKSPREGLKSIKKEDVLPLLIILLFGIVCLAIVIMIVGR